MAWRIIPTLLIIGLLIFFLYIFRREKKIVVLFLNDYEWRWGGGFITMSCEIHFRYGIPRGFRIHDFTQINSYGEPSSGAFKTHLAPTMFFRDANYSLFPEDNFQRLTHFYTKSLHTHPPSWWFQIPFSFLERVLPKHTHISIEGRKVEGASLFRTFTDLVGDNHLPPTKRKEILKRVIPKITLSLLHPYYLIRAIILSISALKSSEILMWKTWVKKQKPSCYIGLCENNLKGRKINRFLTGETHYVLHIKREWNNILTGEGYIDIQRSSFADDQFPYSGSYKCSFGVEASSHFQILWGTELFHEMNSFDVFSHRIPFVFKIPKSALLKVIRQLNTPEGYYSRVSIYTDAFHLLPKTSLNIQHDHWHHQSYWSRENIEFILNAHKDHTPIRMAYRYILDPYTVEIRFQKPINPKKESFEIFSNEKAWTIECIGQSSDQRSIFISTLEPMPFYENKHANNVLTIRIKNISDIQGKKYYEKESREMWLPWRDAK